MNQPIFTHDADGTSESTWFLDPVWDLVPALTPTQLPLDRVDKVVVVSAHPDDETLGIGGTIAALSDAGLPMVLMLATAGEGSNPQSGDWTPDRVAQVRLEEWGAATQVLAPAARRIVLGLPDGQLVDHAAQVQEALLTEVGPGSLVLAPWTGDGHPDHEAAGRAAAKVAREQGALCLHHTIWWWHWNRPELVRNLLQEQALVMEPGAPAIWRKHTALEAFTSQLQGLGPGPEHAPVVTRQVVARGRRPLELLLSEHLPITDVLTTPRPAHDANTSTSTNANTAGPGSLDVASFDAMYDEGDDPWRWEGSWYEERRRALVMATLQRRSYRHVLELGCGTGLVTSQLSGRADTVTAVDVSGRALAIAQRRNLRNVRWVQAMLPGQLPLGRFDVVIVSEIAYFLTPTQLLALLRGIRERLTPGGEVVFADWRAPATGIPLDGPLVHELVGQCLGLPRSYRYADADVLVECWSSQDSPATVEGLA